MKVKPGSVWVSSDNAQFIVIDVVEVDGHTWVHYRNDNKAEPREYSCYEESFVLRFREYVNNKYQHIL